jgi:gliding motility-associated-like protein
MKNFLFTTLLLFSFNVLNAQLVTDAHSFAESCDCYTITPDEIARAGGVFSPNTFDLTNSFDFNFEIYLGTKDLWGADGMVFVLQQTQNYAAAGAGGLGFLGMPNSLGVEIDTYQNSNAPQFDPAGDHVGIYANGDFGSVLTPPTVVPNVEDGAMHDFQVVWDATLQVLVISLDGTPVSGYNGDVVNTIFGGNPNVYWGFTGATGGSTNLQRVCFHREAVFTASKTTVCIGETISFTDNSTSDLNDITNYDWNFDDGSSASTPNASHAFATDGTFDVTLTITDISGCTDVETIQITVLPAITSTVVPTDVSCNGLNDGVLTTTPTNGTGPYTYNWDNGATDVQNPDNLSPNTYNVVITDDLGCTGSAQGIIGEPTALTIDAITPVDASCGANNGSVTFTGTGGTGAYTYAIDGGTFQASNNFTGLASGNHPIQIKDFKGCIVSGTANVGQASLFSMDPVDVTDVSCGAGANDGEIEVTLNNGAANFTYNLTGPVNQNQVLSAQTYTFTNLTPGTYVVTVTDNSTCVVSETDVVVNSATNMVIDGYTVTDVDCNGEDNGEILVNVTGGVAPIQYSIDGGAFQMTNNFNTLAAGTYTIQIKDNDDCVINGDTTIVEPTPLVIDGFVNIMEPTCFGLANASFTVNASGGNGNYTYSLTGGANPQASSDFTNLTEGDYTVTLLEGANCSTTLNGDITINEPATISLDINDVTVTDVTCNGMSDGEIEVNQVTGGTAPYKYSLGSGVPGNMSSFPNLGFGSYDVFVTDDNDCPQATVNVSINESAPLTVTLSDDTTICVGTSANLCAVVSGGQAPYNYYWNGITTFSGPDCLPANMDGNYTVQIVDQNGAGCTSNIATQNVSFFPNIDVNVSNDDIICEGDNALVFAEAVGGNGGPYAYTWTLSTDNSTLDGASHTVSPNVNTTYSLNVSDGCTTPDNTNESVSVSIHQVPQVNISASVQSGCAPLEVEFDNAMIQSLISSQEWDFKNGSISNDSSSTQTFVDEGCYDVNYTFTTSEGCVVDTLLQDFVCVNPYPEAKFEFTPDSLDLLNLEALFLNQSTNSSSFEWDFGTGDISTETNPIYTFPTYGAQDYEIWLKASNSFGCEDSISKILHVTELQYFYIPNAFTPEDNGMNETIKPIFIPGFIPANYKFSIYNRWGELLYQTSDIYSSWDGMFNGELVETGAYVWQIQFRENETDKSYEYSGTVTLLY